MESVELNSVINTLADKLGVAVDNLIPLGEEAVRQYQLGSIVWCVGYFLTSVLLVLFTIILFKVGHKQFKNGTSDDARFIGCLMMGCCSISSLFVFLSFNWAFQSLGRALAPLPNLLVMLT